MFKEFSLTAFLCIKKVFSQFYGTTKCNAQLLEGSLCRSWEMNSDLPMFVQNINDMIISTASSQIRLLNLNEHVKLHFSSLFS